MLYNLISSAIFLIDFLFGNGMSVFGTDWLRKIFFWLILGYAGQSCGNLVDEIVRLSGV